LTAGEEDVLAELEQLEEEVRLDEEKRNGEKEDIIELPAVPTTRLPVVKEPKPTIAKVAVAS
jgi:hypothetical protein